MNNMASQQAPPSSPKDRNVDSGGRKQWPVYSPVLVDEKTVLVRTYLSFEYSRISERHPERKGSTRQK
jgi:hypothetical protein